MAQTKFIAAPVVIQDVPTKHGHVYTKEALEAAVVSFGKRQEKQGTLMGELAKPGLNRSVPLTPNVVACIELAQVSHSFKNVRLVEDTLVCDAAILETPQGKFANMFMSQINGTPVFGLRGLVPGGTVQGNITNFAPVSIDIVDFK